MSEFTDFWSLYTKGREFGYKDPVYAGGWHRGQDIPGVVKEMPWTGKNIPLLRPGKLYYRGYKTKIGYVQVYKVGDEFDTYCHTINTGTSTFRLATWGEKTGTSWGGPHLHLVRSKTWDAAWNTNRAVLDPRPIIRARLAEANKPAGGNATPLPTLGEQDPMTHSIRVDKKHYFSVGAEFIAHHGTVEQATVTRKVTSVRDELHDLTSKQFLDLLDGLGIPRSVVSVKNGLVQFGVLNPETGKHGSNQVWSRTRQAVALLSKGK